MLKIKDNVDLKELEKLSYGHFILKKKYNEDTGELCKLEFRSLYANSLICYCETKNNTNEQLKKVYDNGSTQYETLLYDLIKADIVEKVSDGNE